MKNQAAIRLVSWNIEKGKRWSLLESCLASEALRSADILCLNEVDEGMARSGNRHVGVEIGSRLGMQVAFGPAFREFTKGVGEERLAPGENTIGIQGNATLARFPILEWRNLPLPACHDPSRSEERREGGRHVLIARLDCGSNGGARRLLTVANTHLEVFTTMRCRSRQMRFILDQIGPGPALITGDFNTNTFERGSLLRTFSSLLALMRPGVKSRVISPWTSEPLFTELENAGFRWREFVDNIPTCAVDLSSLEDRKYVPRFIRDRILERIRTLPLKLDFIAARGLRAAAPGRTVTELPCEPSDHLPITCDMEFEHG